VCLEKLPFFRSQCRRCLADRLTIPIPGSGAGDGRGKGSLRQCVEGDGGYAARNGGGVLLCGGTPPAVEVGSGRLVWKRARRRCPGLRSAGGVTIAAPGWLSNATRGTSVSSSASCAGKNTSSIIVRKGPEDFGSFKSFWDNEKGTTPGFPGDHPFPVSVLHTSLEREGYCSAFLPLERLGAALVSSGAKCVDSPPAAISVDAPFCCFRIS
jgi:hypothetical protein